MKQTRLLIVLIPLSLAMQNCVSSYHKQFEQTGEVIASGNKILETVIEERKSLNFTQCEGQSSEIQSAEAELIHALHAITEVNQKLLEVNGYDNKRKAK